MNRLLTLSSFRITSFCLLALWVVLAPAQAIASTIGWNSGFANGGAVPDGNITGWSDTRTLSGLTGNSILNLTVTLQLTGGWNGDIYAYLTHGTGFAVLLNRSGVTGSSPFGYGDNGLNVTFSDTGSSDIHLYQTVPGYSTGIANGSIWQPDGRAVSPLSVTGADPRTALLSSFNGLDPNGDWTLFVADLSNGGVSTVVSWGLDIETTQNSGPSVPDSGSTWALLGLALGGLVWLGRAGRVRDSKY